MHSITGIFQRISPEVQNCDIEKCILMAASEDHFILEIFLDGCFSEEAAKVYLFYKFLHIFYISYFDVMLRGTNFFFFSKGFGAKCKHTQLALNFIQKQYFSEKNTFPLYFSRIGTPWTSKKLLLKFSIFEGILRI